jgi:uncharacterized protein YeaO (DUF488 family)
VTLSVVTAARGELLATLSKVTNFSVGCYCENEAHCHRSVLPELLQEAGAKIE